MILARGLATFRSPAPIGYALRRAGPEELDPLFAVAADAYSEPPGPPQKPNESVAASPKVPARSPVTTWPDGFRLPDGLIVDASTFGWSEM